MKVFNEIGFYKDNMSLFVNDESNSKEVSHVKKCISELSSNYNRNAYASSMYPEYILIKLKKSKLNYRQRKYIVDCVECN